MPWTFYRAKNRSVALPPNANNIATNAVLRELIPMHSPHAANICERLRREGKHTLLEAVEAGTISAFAAAVSLGWVKRAKAREKRREIVLREVDGALSLGQLQELWLGPNPRDGSLFATREELEAAWRQNKDQVMALWGNHGRRPLAFYAFEWTGPRPAYDIERSTLWRAGVLEPGEKAALEAKWKEEFTRTYRPEFFYCAQPGEIHNGAEGRARHCAWADVPEELVKRWSDERQAKDTPGG